MLREIITRYGRKNIGFMWLFIEPLLMTSFIAAMWYFVRAHAFTNLNIVAFIVTGYPIMMMWRNAANRAIGAIDANQGLLYHRNVKVLDTILARIFLEICGATIAQIGIMLGLCVLNIIPWPVDFVEMLWAWGLMAVFAVSMGLIICAVAFKFEALGKLWSTISFLMMPLSGVFFFVSSLPTSVQNILLKIPMIHGTEIFRHGYFGNNVITMGNSWYLLTCDILLLYLGLLLIRKTTVRMGGSA
ncbi:sugar ABC transporter permease [Psittacicella hinzii]|uniref:Transport permease protein n=2 Tax=Psittacicella hinzii TaxID=2028575 RepID=A0A3A1YKJ7_9GAMM|nr:sugar ABC transporter permease [Psittacicella hinzii]